MDLPVGVRWNGGRGPSARLAEGPRPPGGPRPVARQCGTCSWRRASQASLTAFKTELLGSLAVAAPRLEVAVGAPRGAGVRLFLHTHALVVGLGQMANEPPLLAALLADATFSVLHVDLRVEIAAALTTLFAGARP